MIIITGASDGLGREIAKLIVARGQIAISLSRTKPEDDEIDWIKTDLTQEKSITSAVEQLLARKEPIKAFISCAAVVSYESADNLTSAELEKMFGTNVTGPMFLTSKLLERLKRDEADIVNIGATIALKSGYEQQMVYSTTKWALRGFTQNLQSELKK